MDTKHYEKFSLPQNALEEGSSKREPVMLLYGGGIDSTALLRWLTLNPLNNVSAIFIGYGQKAEIRERQACAYFCQAWGVPLYNLHMPFDFFEKSAIMSGSSATANDPKVNVLDGRNLALLSLAGMMAVEKGYKRLAVGFHHEPIARPFPDASPEFLDAVNNVFKQSFIADLKVIAPFKNWTREQIFSFSSQVDSAILQGAHTCYEDVVGGCGSCSHCLTKTEILAEMNRY